MNEKLNKLHEEMQNIIHNQRAMLDRAQAEKRTLTADENISYENADKRVSEIEVDIQREKNLIAREENLKTVDTKPIDVETKSGAPASDLEMKVFRKYLRNGTQALTEQETRILRTHESELRALQADLDIYGGFFVTPKVYASGIIQAMDNEMFIRKYATRYQVATAASLGAVSLDADPADAAWTAEVGSVSEDSTMFFGQRELHPHKLTKLIKVSMDLLRMSEQGIETIVSDRLRYKFNYAGEYHFLLGSGAHQPLGVMTASNLGISTGRDVSTDNETGAITGDGLINAKYTLKAQYWPKARWIFHRDALKQIRKIKSEDNYLFQPGLSIDRPATILDCPYDISEFMSNTFTTGLYVGIIGDFSYYWIADALDLSIQRLMELYAANSQVGYIGRMATDGMPVLEEAFVRVKLG